MIREATLDLELHVYQINVVGDADSKTVRERIKLSCFREDKIPSGIDDRGCDVESSFRWMREEL